MEAFGMKRFGACLCSYPRVALAVWSQLLRELDLLLRLGLGLVATSLDNLRVVDAAPTVRGKQVGGLWIAMEMRSLLSVLRVMGATANSDSSAI